MLKGTQKRMVVVRPEKSQCYEVIYFVLRNDISPQQCTESAMLREANRILTEGTSTRRSSRDFLRKSSRLHSLFLWLAGVLCGGFTIGLIWLITIVYS